MNKNRYCCSCGNRRENSHKIFCNHCVNRFPSVPDIPEGPFTLKDLQELFGHWEEVRPHRSLTKRND